LLIRVDAKSGSAGCSEQKAAHTHRLLRIADRHEQVMERAPIRWENEGRFTR